MAQNDGIKYSNNAIDIKESPKAGETISIYSRPGDDIKMGFDIAGGEYKLVGGDIVLVLPNGGSLTFVSMGIMAFEENAPKFSLSSGIGFDVTSILDQVSEVIQAPSESILTSSNITPPEIYNNTQITQQQLQELKSLKNFYEETQKQNQAQDQMQALRSLSDTLARESDPFLQPNDLTSQETNNFSEPTRESQPVDVQRTTDTTHVNTTKTAQTEQIDLTNYISKQEVEEKYQLKNENTSTAPAGAVDAAGEGSGTGTGDGTGTGTGDGNVSNAAKPNFYFSGTAHQLAFTDDTVNLQVAGGGGSQNAYIYSSVTNQAESETIDISSKTQDYTIRADSATYFSSDPNNIELSRVLRFTPKMPEGFYVQSFTISGLPSGFALLDEEGNAISGNTITKEDMIYKDESGNVVLIDDADFVTKAKTVEFVVKYPASSSSFDMTITSTYLLDEAYTDTTDIDPTQTYSVPYSVLMKDISTADDYTYTKTGSGQAEGFVLAKSINGNIIKDGSGNDTIYGGVSADEFYNGGGDDTTYGGAGNDTFYGGTGYNTIYADRAESGTDYAASSTADKMSYSTLTGSDDDYYGAYIDLKGITLTGIDANSDGTTGDIVNAISKYTDTGAFAATASGSTSTNTGTGYDVIYDVENVDGSSLNDYIYGDDNKNIINGLAGSDTLDGRGGSDTINGGAGYDTILSGSGDDTIDGGSDTDTISFANATGGVSVRMDVSSDYATGYGNDTFSNIEDVVGSSYADIIVGDGNTNYISAGDGNDVIFAGGGYDFIDGGAGSDWVSYYAADYTTNSYGNFSATDTVAGFMESINGITADLNSSDFVMLKETSTGRLIDLVKNIEQVRGTNGVDRIYGGSSNETFWGFNGNDIFYGRSGNDTLYGDAGNDSLYGEAGNDSLYGGSGDDYLRPGTGIDTVDGGDGTDYLELYDDALLATQSLELTDGGTMRYSTDGGTTWIDGYFADGGVNTAINIESFGVNTTFTGNLFGNSGNNTLRGYAGNNTIDGRAGNDTIYGGTEDDTLYGGDGNDTLYGEANNDTIYGGDGDDTIYGTAYYSNSAQDKDIIDGGAGIDTLTYQNVTQAMTADLSTGIVNFTVPATAVAANYTDTFSNIEKFIGGNGADTITGSANGETIDGWGGVDNINAGDGNDTVIARNTSGEVLNGGNGIDTLQLAQNVDFRNQTISNFENLDTGAFYSYFNYSQISQFDSIQGSGRVYVYGTNNAETFDFSGIDFTNFTGTIYAWGYNGNDTFNMSGVTQGGATFYLDAGGNTDTLTLGAGQTFSMDAGYTNTFETFTSGGANANLVMNGTAANNSYNFSTKTVSGFDGVIDFNGLAGNDTFYLDLTQVDKIRFDGGAGTDNAVVYRADSPLVNASLTDSDLFSNIETLTLTDSDLYDGSTLTLDAVSLDNYNSSGTLTLDIPIPNSAYGSEIRFNNMQSSTPNASSGVSVGTSYAIDTTDADTNTNYTLAVI